MMDRMQQLYRCTSWWLAHHPHRSPALLVRKKDRQKLAKNQFASAYIEVLQKTIGLQVLHYLPIAENHRDGHKSIPIVVRSKDTNKWEMDIAITDFALLDPQRRLHDIFASQLPAGTTIEPPCTATTTTTTTTTTTSTTLIPRRQQRQRRRLPRIAILNRNITSGRHVLNAPEIAAAIKKAYPTISVPIVYFEQKTFLEQIQFFMETDILLTPHGAQLTGMAFLPPCAAVLEFFPNHYLVPDYFGSLAAAINVSHNFLYLGNNFHDHATILPYEKYHYVNKVDKLRHKDDAQCPDLLNVLSAVTSMVDNWQTCCAPLPPTTLLTEQSTTTTSSSSSSFSTTLSLPTTTSVTTSTVDPFLTSVDIISIAHTAHSSNTPTTTEQPEQPHPGQRRTDVQATTFGAHRYVRDYYAITAWNDTNQDCQADLTRREPQWSTYCGSDPNTNKRKDRSVVSRLLRSDLMGSDQNSPHNNRTAEHLCDQIRFVDGFHKVIQQYQPSDDGTRNIPDYLILIQEDTYLHIDTLVPSLHQSYDPREPHVLAGCTHLLRPKDLYLVYPVHGLASILTRAAVERILAPIHCDGGLAATAHASRPQPTEAFLRWTCWRIAQDNMGEKRFFTNGMSMIDLMLAYASQLPYTPIQQWNHVGYCVPSDTLFGYFFNYYHIALPDWILNDTAPTDQVRKQYSYKKLVGSMEEGHSGVGGECANSNGQCHTHNARICHGLTMEQMTDLYQQQHRTMESDRQTTAITE
jgi:hypothetical protein